MRISFLIALVVLAIAAAASAAAGHRDASRDTSGEGAPRKRAGVRRVMKVHATPYGMRVRLTRVAAVQP